MKQYKIEIICAEDFADKGVEVLEHITEMLDNIYGDVSEYKAEIEDLKDEIIYLERKIAIRDNALKDRDKAIEMLEGKQDTIVKQAKIDVLNELRAKLFCMANSWMFIGCVEEFIRKVEKQ